MKRYSKLYWQFFKARLKVMMEYRVDFLIGVFSVFFIQGTSILFVNIVFNQIDALHGWTYHQIMFIYAIALLGRSIEHIFFDNLWTIGFNYIRPGNFDRLMIRPVNVLFHIIADRVQQDGVGNLLIGLIVLVTSSPHLGIDWGLADILLLIVMIVSSSAVFLAVNLFFASFSFWMVDSLPIMMAVHGTSDFARYPLSIYNKGIRFVLTWIIPYGFTAFYPAAVFLDPQGFKHFAVLSPIVAAVSLTVAYMLWNRGLRAFSSTGN
ncbi:protein of unknown function DUF990 [Paenibacillus curdlanolyticus YK9]|uniref:ABC transporter permease n=1 Tax=Paenibacillus curdlanolyticus YK9 TaxID=717606 RepID=E0I7T0_9BACL|nr:ABC-2 family transporter protein [Paenibacillus curdlanolyticus]EFM11235.1 protein of unknown function DUF990 [Paenibacillus curdlanolyticus YK9]